MSDLQMWSLLVGVAAPLLVAVVQQPGWTRPVRAVVGLIIFLLLGLGTAYFEGALTGRSWISSALIIFVAANTAYRNLWKPTRVAPAIEQATSPGQGRAVDADAA